MSTVTEEQMLLEDREWKGLMHVIQRGLCTPFLGPELSDERYLRREQIAAEWALREGYPLPDRKNLSRVAQFLAAKYDPTYPYYEIAEVFQDAKTRPPAEQDIHAALADLPMKMYISTCYDNLMFAALEASVFRKPALKICRWKDELDPTDPRFTTDFSCDKANPVVFHLFGHVSLPESLVLTERDYIEFLINVSKSYRERIPAKVDEAFSRAYLLFLGYRLADLDFLVLLCSLGKKLQGTFKNKHISVQLADATPETRDYAEDYLRNYLNMFDVRVCLGTSVDFVGELDRRWRAEA